MDRASQSHLKGPALEKAPTGIEGLDQITLGGLPRGRPTLICGSAGCGKTLFGMDAIAIREARQPTDSTSASVGLNESGLPPDRFTRLSHGTDL